MIPVALAWLAVLQSEGPGFELRAEAWFANVSGSMKFDEKPGVGDRTDLAGDLGADDAIVPELTFRVTLPADRFTISALRIAWDAEDSLDRSRRWNESLFPAGEPVETAFDFFQGELGWEHRIVEGDFQAWAGLAGRYLRLEAVLESATLGRDDDHIVTFAPAVSGDVRWRIRDSLFVEGALRLTYLPTQEMSARGTEAALGLEWRPHDSWSFRAGWRGEWLRLVKDNSLERNDLRSRLDGFFVGLAVTF